MQINKYIYSFFSFMYVIKYKANKGIVVVVAMQVRFWSVFKVGQQVSIIFWIHRFLRSSRYFSRLSHRLTFIMLNVGMVAVNFSRKVLNSGVQNTCSTTGFRADMAEPCYHLFSH